MQNTSNHMTTAESNGSENTREYNPFDGDVRGTKYSTLTEAELANPQVHALMGAGVSVHTIRRQIGSDMHKKAHFVDHSGFNMTGGE